MSLASTTPLRSTISGRGMRSLDAERLVGRRRRKKRELGEPAADREENTAGNRRRPDAAGCARRAAGGAEPVVRPLRRHYSSLGRSRSSSSSTSPIGSVPGVPGTMMGRRGTRRAMSDSPISCRGPGGSSCKCLFCQPLDAIEPRQQAPFRLQQLGGFLLFGDPEPELHDLPFAVAPLVLQRINEVGRDEHAQDQHRVDESQHQFRCPAIASERSDGSGPIARAGVRTAALSLADRALGFSATSCRLGADGTIHEKTKRRFRRRLRHRLVARRPGDLPASEREEPFHDAVFQ